MFMKKLELVQGISAQVSDGIITMRGSLGTNARKFNTSLLSVRVDGSAVVVEGITGTKTASKAASAENSLAKELSNDIAGVNAYFEKRMTVVYAHFPMTIEVKGDTLSIKNMFGERALRHAKIVGSTKVEVKAQSVRVYGTSLDDVSQTAANIRQACKVKNKDTRVFQDGIYHEIE